MMVHLTGLAVLVVVIWGFETTFGDKSIDKDDYYESKETKSCKADDSLTSRFSGVEYTALTQGHTALGHLSYMHDCYFPC